MPKCKVLSLDAIFFISTEMSVALDAYFKGGCLKTTPLVILKHFCKKRCMSMRSFQLKQSKLSTSALWKELKISLYTSCHLRRFVLFIYLCHSKSLLSHLSHGSNKTFNSGDIFLQIYMIDNEVSNRKFEVQVSAEFGIKKRRTDTEKNVSVIMMVMIIVVVRRR